MDPSMFATPDPVLIDGETSGTTVVIYSTGFTAERAFLWQRRNFGDWSRVSDIDAPTGNPNSEGTFAVTMQLGEVYDVVLFHEPDVDPSQPDIPAPDLQTTVVALKKAPADVSLISAPDEFGTTGTSIQWTFSTTRPTAATVQVGKEPPVVGSDGMPRFDTVLASLTDFGFLTSHDIRMKSRGLLPGNSFHALLRVSDQHGNWQTAQQPFRMKQRSVTVVLDQLHIIDDGADGNTTASFKVWVLDGARLKNRFDVPDQTISDSPSPGNVSEEFIRFSDISPEVKVEIGPDTVTTTGVNRNDTLGILTRGIAAAFGDDNISGNYLPGPGLAPGDPPDLFTGTPDPGTLFDFPIGHAAEVVDQQPFVVRAKPLGSHEFEYDVSVMISVHYT